MQIKLITTFLFTVRLKYYLLKYIPSLVTVTIEKTSDIMPEKENLTVLTMTEANREKSDGIARFVWKWACNWPFLH